MTYQASCRHERIFRRPKREKIIEALRRGMGKSQAARTFCVSLSSVKRYAKLAEAGRSPPRRDPPPSPSSTSEPASSSKRTSKRAPFHHSATKV
jgi:transposase